MNEAKRWQRFGVSTVPIQARNKHIDKDALIARGYEYADLKSTLPTKDDLEFWFSGGRRKLAIVTGDVIAVDFDHIASYSYFKVLYPQFINTYIVETPAINKPSPKCYHCYYWLNEPVDKPIEPTWPDIDLKYGGLNVITAGAGYQVINDTDPMRLESIFDLPFVRVREQPIPPRKEENIAANSSFFAGERTTNVDAKYVKYHVPIDKYLSDLGHVLKPVGTGKFITNCPFPASHSNGDAHPSFWIDTRFENCNCNKLECKNDRHMDIFDLYQKINSCSFQEAIFDLATAYGLI